MPLKKSGKGCVGQNISELTEANKKQAKKRPRKQIVAMALDACGKSRKQKVGTAKPK